MKKVDALTKAMEVEWKKMKKEAAAREKEGSSTKSDDNRKHRSTNSSKRFCNFICSGADFVLFVLTLHRNNVLKLLQGNERPLRLLYLEIVKCSLFISDIL